MNTVCSMPTQKVYLLNMSLCPLVSLCIMNISFCVVGDRCIYVFVKCFSLFLTETCICVCVCVCVCACTCKCLHVCITQRGHGALPDSPQHTEEKSGPFRHTVPDVGQHLVNSAHDTVADGAPGPLPAV